MEIFSPGRARSDFVELSRMIEERITQEALSRPLPRRTTQAMSDHADRPPVIERSVRGVVLPLIGVTGLAFVLMCVSLLLKWNVPLPRCAFKTVTGFPCFTCGSTRALAALGRCDVFQALQLNPLVTVACAAAPIWLGIALLAAASGSRLHLRWPFKLKTTLLLLAAAAFLNWIYLLLELPK